MIQTSIDRKSVDFYTMVRNSIKVDYIEKDSIKSFKSLWGYSDGKAIHLNRGLFPEYNDIVTNDNSFIRVGIFGNISLMFFVKNTSGGMTPYGGYQPGRSKPVEIIFDARSGNRYKATLKNLEKLINDDPELLAEFKKDKDEMDVKLYMFIKKYNEKHPFKFKD